MQLKLCPLLWDTAVDGNHLIKCCANDVACTYAKSGNSCCAAVAELLYNTHGMMTVFLSGFDLNVAGHRSQYHNNWSYVIS